MRRTPPYDLVQAHSGALYLKSGMSLWGRKGVLPVRVPTRHYPHGGYNRWEPSAARTGRSVTPARQNAVRERQNRTADRERRALGGRTH